MSNKLSTQPPNGQARNPGWLRALIGLGIVLGAGLLIAFVVAIYEDVKSPGELAFAEETVDIGRLAIGQQVVYRFSMRNSGGKPVNIKKMSASAVEGC